jgi:hypothetical protein
MRAVRRIACVSAISLATVAATASLAVAAPKEVSAERYAKTVCGAYTDLRAAGQEYNEAYLALPTSDPATTQAQIGELAKGLVDDVSALRTKLKNQYPEVDDGEKISKLFVKNLKAVQNEISSSLEALQAADPNGATFTDDLTTFEVAIEMLDAKTSDPFRKLKDQDVIAALGDEKSCDDIVVIVGG